MGHFTDKVANVTGAASGIAVGAEVRDCSIDDWRDVLDTNLMGVVHGVASAYPLMVQQGCGHIIKYGFN